MSITNVTVNGKPLADHLEAEAQREELRQLLRHLRRRQRNDKTAKRERLIEFWQQIALLPTPQQRVAFWRRWNNR